MHIQNAPCDQSHFIFLLTPTNSVIWYVLPPPSPWSIYTVMRLSVCLSDYMIILIV